MAKLYVPHFYVPDEDAEELVHTDSHPFCSDPDCPCHNDENVAEHIDPYLDDGTMSGAEAFRTYFGK